MAPPPAVWIEARDPYDREESIPSSRTNEMGKEGGGSGNGAGVTSKLLPAPGGRDRLNSYSLLLRRYRGIAAHFLRRQ